MCFRAFGWMLSDPRFLRAGEFRLQCFGDRCRDLAFHCENIGEFAVKRVCPEMCGSCRINQLHVDADLIARSLYAAFKDVRHAKLLGYLRKIGWLTLKL